MIRTGFRKAALFALGGFLAGGALGLRQDGARAAFAADLAARHAAWMERAGEDLERLDFTAFLAAHPAVRAYRVVQGPPGGGIGFRPPADWILQRPLRVPGGPERHMELHLRLAPGPLLPALAGSLLAWGVFRVASSGAEGSADSPRPEAPPVPPETRGLRLDRSFRLRAASPDAARRLQKTPEDLAGRHLLELSPSAELLDVLRGGKEPDTSLSLTDPPSGLRVRVRALPDGWDLEIAGDSESAPGNAPFP